MITWPVMACTKAAPHLPLVIGWRRPRHGRGESSPSVDVAKCLMSWQSSSVASTSQHTFANASPTQPQDIGGWAALAPGTPSKS